MIDPVDYKSGAVLIIVLLLIIIFIKGYKAPESFGMRSDPSPIYEYAVCIFIVAFHFLKEGYTKKIFGIICLCFALQNFIFGGRITGLQYLICFYLFIFSHKIKILSLLIIVIPITFIMVLIGAVRGALLTGDFSYSSVLQYIINTGGALDTAYSAFYTSEIFVFAQSRIAEHFSYFAAFILAIFIGYASFPGKLLQNVADSFMTNYAGGIFPYYFYFFLGWVGVIISTLILRPYFLCISKIGLKNHGLSKCIAAFFICHTFRWYLYTPYSLIRGTLFITVIYLIFNYMCIKKRRISNIVNFEYQK